MLTRVSAQLKQLEKQPFKALVGFDGFVDEIVHVVDQRISPTEYSRIKTLKAYGERIAAASGLSTNVEIVPTTKKLGGNGPIFALGLKKYGAQLIYIGCTGVEETVDVFSELAENATVIGVAEPGYTDAVEFHDGKLIQSKLDTLNCMDWECITTKIPARELARLMDDARLISFNNWTMLPWMSQIWQHILSDVIPLMKQPTGGKVLFFDLADPAKRSEADIREALHLIHRFRLAGFETVLGLNKKEAREIALTLHPEQKDVVKADLKTLVTSIYEAMGVDCIVVHPLDRAACMKHGVYTEVTGPYCQQPKLTTGAGDNFNAGFVYAYTMGLEADHCLALGAATSGFYVRSGHSPSYDEIQTFLEDWRLGQLDRDLNQ